PRGRDNPCDHQPACRGRCRVRRDVGREPDRRFRVFGERQGSRRDQEGDNVGHVDVCRASANICRGVFCGRGHGLLPGGEHGVSGWEEELL
ncbi:hypothetical protein HK101_006188, partial [Irineochytrium annulatum]